MTSSDPLVGEKTPTQQPPGAPLLSSPQRLSVGRPFREGNLLLHDALTHQRVWLWRSLERSALQHLKPRRKQPRPPKPPPRCLLDKDVRCTWGSAHALGWGAQSKGKSQLHCTVFIRQSHPTGGIGLGWPTIRLFPSRSCYCRTYYMCCIFALISHLYCNKLREKYNLFYSPPSVSFPVLSIPSCRSELPSGVISFSPKELPLPLPVGMLAMNSLRLLRDVFILPSALKDYFFLDIEFLADSFCFHLAVGKCHSIAQRPPLFLKSSGPHSHCCPLFVMHLSLCFQDFLSIFKISTVWLWLKYGFLCIYPTWGSLNFLNLWVCFSTKCEEISAIVSM